MKKIKLFLLTLLITAIPKSLGAYTVHQIVSFDGGQTHYKVLIASGPNASLMFLGTKQQGRVEIPATIDDNKGITFTVTEIGFQAGYPCNGVTSVKLPETIVKINNDCFQGAKLTDLNIPKSVVVISEWAWSAMNEIPKCKVEDGNTKFESDDKGVLYTKGKKALRCIPSKIMSTGGSQTYTIDNAVDTICVNAFHNIFNLKKIVLPPNLKLAQERYPSIVTNTDLVEFELPGGGNTNYKVVEGVLFNNITKTLVCYPKEKATTEYQVPDDIKKIAPFAFMFTKFMTSIDLNHVTQLERSAFYKPQKLETITIPKELTKAGLVDGAFEECVKLKAYQVADGNPDFSAELGVLFSKDKTKLCYYPPAKEGEKYDIPSTVTEIGQKAFQGAVLLKSMVIPAKVDSIGIEAFRNMVNLEKVEFKAPATIRILKADVFRACKNLKEVVLPASITELASAFYECESLEKVTIPNGSKLKKIKDSAFATNKKLKNFIFEGSCDLTTIEANAFANAESLETFEFPKSVTTIGLNAFSGCNKMTSVKFDPEAEIKEIGAGAFADCGLQGISIPKKVEKIAKEAFRNCKVLEKIEVSEFTTSIDPEAFKHCDKLDDIKVSKDNKVYSSIDGYLLSKDKKTLILFPPGKANDKFTLLPPSIEKIGDNSFLDCKKLTNVTIPNKVTSIGKRTFGLCTNLKTITFLCDKMISADSINTKKNEMSFDDGTQTGGQSMFDNITINIRKELFDNYNNEPFYKRFQGGIQQSFTVEDEEYIAMSEQSVNMLSTKRKDHTFVIPTSITHNSKNYSVNLIGDYAFQKVTADVKEVVVKKDVEYIGAQAFVTKKEANGELKSTVEKVFFIESNPTAKMLSTTRFELDETKTNYNEFAKTTKIYVKRSALNTYKEKWNKMVYNPDTKTSGVSPFNFIEQISYKIPGVKITDQYGTFAREFDTDFSIYKQENNNKGNIAAFVAKDGDVRKGNGDYGTSAYNVKMRSIDEKGGVSDNYGYVPAYTGVLLKVLDNKATPSDFYYAIGEKDDQTYTINNNIMHGITVNTKPVSASAADPIYVIQGGIFRKVTNDIASFTIHKAYAKIPGVPANAPVTFSFSDDDTTTGVMTIDAEKPMDNTYYNLNGQRVTNPQRGIYIQGGRKVIIK